MATFAKTFDWRITGNDTQAAQFAAYHGETVSFNLMFSGAASNCTAAAARIYYQTNGMDQAWWPTDGLTFAPTNDVGAAAYRFFVRAQDDLGVNYTANGILRMLPSPGFEPSVVELPVKTLDFDLIDVLHAPWATPDDVAAVRDDLLDYVPLDGDSTITGDITINGEVSIIGTGGLGVDGGLSVYSGSAALYGGIAIGPAGDQRIDGNRDGDKIIFEGHGQDGSNRSELQPDGSDVMTSNRVAAAISTLSDSIPTTTSNIVTKAYVEDLGISSEESDPTVPAWSKANTKPTYTASEVGATTAEDVYRIVAGTNIVLVVTNYNSATHAPAMKLQHLDPQSGEYVTYWDETRRHALTLTNAMDYADSQVATRAPKAWSRTTSGLGSEAPDGVTWISTPETVIAGGYEYEKVITSSGAVWVLSSNGLTTGATTNAFFRVTATDGTELFAIEKTDSFLIGVNPDGITQVDNTVTIPVNVVADAHPYIRATTNLVNAVWTKEDEDGFTCPWATVSWSGTTGAYVATVTCSEPQAFFYFEYLVEGGAKIKNSAPVEMASGIYFDGYRYMPVVNGSKLEFIRQ